MKINKEMILSVFEKVIVGNKALAEVLQMDEQVMMTTATIIAELLTNVKDVDDGREHGEFFLLKWPAPDGAARGVVPEPQRRFLSRTAALDVAHMLNEAAITQAHPQPYYDVASLDWVLRYIEMIRESEHGPVPDPGEEANIDTDVLPKRQGKKKAVKH